MGWRDTTIIPNTVKQCNYICSLIAVEEGGSKYYFAKV